MNYVCEKNKCTGCMACEDICPVGAINIIDEISHFNASIDSNKCLNCNLCKKVCQRNYPPEHKEAIYWVQGWSKSENNRRESSSGGFAYELMKTFVNKGGYVCSCRYENGVFGFYITNRIDEIKLFVGSKYVKSNPKGIYKQIKSLLKEGEKVLFVGLPCQVAGVLNFTHHNPNLYTVDLICHGTPSPKVLESFLNSKNLSIIEIKKFSFRTNRGYEVITDGKTHSLKNIRDYYTMLFADAVSLTENCYSCEYANIDRISDITIGDSWGCELPDKLKKDGVSLALCQTSRGKELLEESDVELFDVDLERAKSFNPQLYRPSKKSPKTDSILNDVAKGINYNTIIRKNFTKRYYKNVIKRIFYKLGLLK